VSAASTRDYALALGDDSLVMAQRLGEWIASAPQIEEDIALGNLALDQLGQARALLIAHHLGGHVPATVSGSTSRMLVDDGLAERRDGRTTPGRRRGHYTRLTAAGRVLAARLAAEQETTQGWDVEPVRSTA